MKESSNNKNDGQGAENSPEFKDLYYDKQEVLQLFHISSRTLQEWRDKNLITYFKFGQKTYYLKDSINKFIADRTIPAKTNSSPDRNMEGEGIQENGKDLLTDTGPTEISDNKQSKSFSKLWEPIPGYLVPLILILAYLTPYLEPLIEGKPIQPAELLVPLEVGITGCLAYSLVRLGAKISKKFKASRKVPK